MGLFRRINDRRLRGSRLLLWSAFVFHLLWDFAEDLRIDFLSHIYGLVYGRSGGNDAHVYLLFACQANACDEARPEVDHASVDARHVGVWGEHKSHNRRTKDESPDRLVENISDLQVHFHP